MIGQTLKDRYRIDAKVGSGAMGEVYRAADLQSGDVVAIKVMARDLAEQPTYRQRFEREVITLRKLKHPHIISFVDAFSTNQNLCMVMEYVGGGNLKDMIEAKGQIPEGLFKRIALQITDAVSTAHQLGIVHRDLKPANILMTATGDPRIADFGIAKLTEATTLTVSGELMGTLAYMPPEAFDNLLRPDFRADIWALGVIFYEMLSGNLPFRGRSQPATIAAILADPPVPLYSYRKEIPPAWHSIINACLQKLPADRYQSAADLLDDLRGDHCRFGGFEPRPIQIGDHATNTRPHDETFPTWLDEAATSKNTDYEFQFIKSAPPPNPHPVGSSKRKPLPGMTDAPQPISHSSPAGLIIISGLFLWIGIITLILTAILAVISFTKAADSLNVDGDTLRLIQAIGAMLFVIGVFFELPDAKGMRKLLLVALAGWAGVTWLVCFSGLIIPLYFITSLMGMLFYLLLIAMYFQLNEF